MELSEFIAETLVQLAKGIKDSQDAVRECGGISSPAFNKLKARDDSDQLIGYTLDQRHVYAIDFDVSIEVLKGEGNSKSGKINVGGFVSFGGDGTSSASSNSTSRVRFRIPYSPPLDPESHADMQEKRQSSTSEIPRRAGGFMT
jgi:hypothetical protein